jgi:hypothetical protein
MRIFVLAVDNKADIQFSHTLRNPTWPRISRRKGQVTESMTLDMSALKRRQGSLRA